MLPHVKMLQPVLARTQQDNSNQGELLNLILQKWRAEFRHPRVLLTTFPLHAFTNGKIDKLVH